MYINNSQIVGVGVKVIAERQNGEIIWVAKIEFRTAEGAISFGLDSEEAIELRRRIHMATIEINEKEEKALEVKLSVDRRVVEEEKELEDEEDLDEEDLDKEEEDPFN